MARPGQAGAGSQGDGAPLIPRAPLAPVSSCLVLVFLGTRKSSVITSHPFIGIYPSLLLLTKYYGDFGLEKEQRKGSGGCVCYAGQLFHTGLLGLLAIVYPSWETDTVLFLPTSPACAPAPQTLLMGYVSNRYI